MTIYVLAILIGLIAGLRAMTALAAMLHQAGPAALIEDAVAIGGAAIAMAALV